MPQTVPRNHVFVFPGMCPHCESDIAYRVVGWDEDDNCEQVEFKCQAEPAPSSPNHTAWAAAHSDQQAQSQMDNHAMNYINQNFEFED